MTVYPRMWLRQALPQIGACRNRASNGGGQNLGWVVGTCLPRSHDSERTVATLRRDGQRNGCSAEYASKDGDG